MKFTRLNQSTLSNFMLFFSLIFFFFSCNSNLESSSTIERTKTNINQNWWYLENDTESISDALSAQNWQTINLPHSWNSLDATDLEPGYRRSGSWYKKTIDVSLNSNTIYELYFEGVNITSEIYVNNTKVGTHIGGYIGFTIDISKALKTGQNEIIVRVDNSYDPEIIPSQKSDFFIYGGITRDVWLQTIPKTHLANLKYTTPNVSEENATLKGTVAVINGHKTSKVKVILKDTENKIVFLLIMVWLKSVLKTLKTQNCGTQKTLIYILLKFLWLTKIILKMIKYLIELVLDGLNLKSMALSF